MKRIAIAAILACLAVYVADAQVRTSYFVRNSTLNHNFNPAFAPDQGYVGFPFLSNIYIGTKGNLGLSSVLYPLDNGKLGLFLHPDIPVDQALSGFSAKNTLGASFNYDLINAGWFTGKDSFWTLSLGLNLDMDISVPYELAEFMKVGMSQDPTSYSIAGICSESELQARFSLGYSRGLDNLVKGLRIGGKLHLISSIASAYANVDRMDINMSSERWTVNSKASGMLYGSGIVFNHDENGYISGYGFDYSNLRPAGYGAGLDLGIEYTLSEGTPVDGLRFALSVRDLGFMVYGKNTAYALQSDNGEVVFEGFEGIGLETDLNQQINELTSSLLGITSLKEVAVDKNCVEMLSTKMHASVDYSFLGNKMNVGLLYSGKFGRLIDEHELTLAWNYAPARWFDIALSYSMLNTGTSIGWLFTFVPRKGLNLFIGSDYTSFNYSSLGIPVHGAYMNVNLGISVPLGGKNRRY